MKWQLHDLGFLPVSDPLTRLAAPELQPLERLGAELPQLVHSRSFRAASVEYLSGAPAWEDLLLTLEDRALERLFMLFSYFASAYVHAPGLPPVQRLPQAIAGPLVRLAQRVERPPILSYASYCLHNWRRHDPAGPVALGNIALLQNFSTPDDGKRDEDWFILVHVDIEAHAGSGLQALARAPAALAQGDAAGVADILERLAASMAAMNRTLQRMPEGCSAEVYFRKVRPYIFGFFDVVYEGCFDNAPQSYRGETGAQSSIVPTLLMALGVQHKNTLLTTHLGDMRTYMPAPHRRFIAEQVSVRDLVQRASASAQNGSGSRLRQIYNTCIDELIAFRSRHFEYAVSYIEKKVDNPLATGGTPYMPWLRQLIEETKEYYLR
jgi:indoleamine 2,3-dioxygenase